MSENWKIQVSPRVGDTLINLRAETGEEAERILAWATEHAADIQKAVAAFGGASAVAAVLPVASTTVEQGGWNTAAASTPPPFAQQPQAQYAQAATQQAPPVQQGGGETCIHGPMKYKESAPGAAKAWKAWMCPTPKGTPGQCDPVWIR